MKRFISLFLSLLLVFLITGCQAQLVDAPSAQGPDTQESTEPDVSEPTEPNAQDAIQPEQPEAEESEEQPTAEQEPEGPEAPDETENTVTNETTSGVTEVEKENDQAALIGCLDEMRQNVRVGTAGSSLTAAQAAANLLDWGMETVLSDAEMQAIAQDWYDSFDSADQEEIQMQLSGVAGAVEQVTGEEGAGLLDSAGCTESSYPWNDTAKTAVEAVLATIPEAE